MSSTDTQSAETAPLSGHPIFRLTMRWAAGTVLGLVLVTATYLVAGAVSDPLVIEGAGEVALGNVIGFAILGATIGGILAYVMERFTRRPRATFLAMTLIALAGYAVVPFTAAEALPTAIWLNVFHVTVAIPVIGLLALNLPKRRA